MWITQKPLATKPSSHAPTRLLTGTPNYWLSYSTAHTPNHSLTRFNPLPAYPLTHSHSHLPILYHAHTYIHTCYSLHTRFCTTHHPNHQLPHLLTPWFTRSIPTHPVTLITIDSSTVVQNPRRSWSVFGEINRVSEDIIEFLRPTPGSTFVCMVYVWCMMYDVLYVHYEC